MKDQRTSYREQSPWPGWVNAIFWGAMLVSCYPLIAGWDTDLEFTRRLLIVTSIMSVAVGLKVVMGGLTVRVQEDRVFIHLGSVPLVKKLVPFDSITDLESVQYSPIREFGGWGVRGLGKKRAWTSRGDQAVVLMLENGTHLYVGSDHPRRLEERIRAAVGERLR